ncbi:MAG: hypothetical protein WC556_01785 [Candidatus Methanoperedens sp.]
MVLLFASLSANSNRQRWIFLGSDLCNLLLEKGHEVREHQNYKQ